MESKMKGKCSYLFILITMVMNANIIQLLLCPFLIFYFFPSSSFFTCLFYIILTLFKKIFNLISFKYYIFVDREVFWDFDIINICPFFLSFFFFKFSKYNNKTFIDDYHHFKDSHYSFLFFSNGKFFEQPNRN